VSILSKIRGAGQGSKVPFALGPQMPGAHPSSSWNENSPGEGGNQFAFHAQKFWFLCSNNPLGKVKGKRINPGITGAQKMPWPKKDPGPSFAGNLPRTPFGTRKPSGAFPLAGRPGFPPERSSRKLRTWRVEGLAKRRGRGMSRILAPARQRLLDEQGLIDEEQVFCT